jgi:hypothetical protein
MSVFDNDTVILVGYRNATNGLWHVDLAPPATIHMANAIGDPSSADLVAFSLATLFLPVLSTLENALIRCWLINFPGLTLEALRKHPPRSIAMAKGHLDQSRKNQRSTKPAPTVIPPEPIPPTLSATDSSPDQSTNCSLAQSTKRTHHIYATTFEPTGQIYSNQTGRFVTPSSNGNNYMMIVYDYDSNHIFIQPFRNRTAKCLLEAFCTIHTRLVKAGLRPQLHRSPQLHRLDNKCSTQLKDFLHAKDIKFQLVPPAVHQRNAAERAI